MSSTQQLDELQYEWTEDLQDILEITFGLESLSEIQSEVINATLCGKDVFAIMPTGAGKSLTYQISSLIKTGATKGTTIVISPMLSLIREQVSKLRLLGINAVSLSSEITRLDQEAILDSAKGPHPPSLLYMTPEFLSRCHIAFKVLEALKERSNLARFAIDEVHLVVQFGLGFRRDFAKMSCLRKKYPGVPFLCLTATSSQGCKDEAMRMLGLNQSEVQDCRISIDRENLRYSVVKKSENSLQNIVDIINDGFKEDSVIIYCLTRKEAESIAEKLRKQGISAKHYHSKVKMSDKHATQDEWQSGACKVLVATVAFGLGIHKDDVRLIIHYMVPRSMEAYCHEIGRAGRDKKLAYCLMFYSSTDIKRMRSLMRYSGGPNCDAELYPEDPTTEDQQKDGSKSPATNAFDQSYALRRLIDVNQYALNNWTCRVRQMLQFFSEQVNFDNCGGRCDVCVEDPPMMEDLTELASHALRLIEESCKGETRYMKTQAYFGQNPRLTLRQAAMCLWGSKNKRDVLNKKADQFPGYNTAMGMEQSTAELLFGNLINLLVIEVEDRYYQDKTIPVLKIASQEAADQIHNGLRRVELKASDVKVRATWHRLDIGGKWLCLDTRDPSSCVYTGDRGMTQDAVVSDRAEAGPKNSLSLDEEDSSSICKAIKNRA